ncbi:hypothetical protein [Helicobacter jaachi]|nr:hypothetical protein [Helicobacter jaachi]
MRFSSFRAFVLCSSIVAASALHADETQTSSNITGGGADTN